MPKGRPSFSSDHELLDDLHHLLHLLDVDIFIRAVTVGERLMALRKEACLSQLVMAQKLGITQNAVWRYEHGVTPAVDVLVRFADFFDVSLDWVAGRTDKREGVIYSGVNADDKARMESYLSKLLSEESGDAKRLKKIMAEAFERKEKNAGEGD